MNSYVQKCLFLVVVFAAGVATTSQDALANCSAGGSSLCDTEGQAWVLAAQAAAYWDGVSGGSYCHVQVLSATSVGARLSNNTTPCNNEFQKSTWSFVSDCSEQPGFNGWITHGNYSNGIAPAAPSSIPTSCANGCLVIADGPSSCSSADTQPNGTYDDDGDTYSCRYNFNNEGSGCVEGGIGSGSEPTPDLGSEAPPNGNEYDCSVVDCSSPTPPPASSDPNDSGGSNSNDSGGNSGGGDGDPDTPGSGDGTGDGDTDEDGERDIDCNPLSNPDCAFRGSASASNYCGNPPSYFGVDPVQGAQLMQQYNIMCAILKTAADDGNDTNNNTGQATNDCVVPPSCSSDNPVECVAIRQAWENTCMLIDVDSETSLSDDPDYGRDLAGEGEGTEVDISSGLDETGLGTGTCPAPIAINTTWANFTIDTAPLCSIAGWVRVFVILFTLLWAGPYVVRSF